VNIWHDFPGLNAGYILELYDRYQQNPDSVDVLTKRFFEQWGPPLDGLGLSSTVGQVEKIMAIDAMTIMTIMKEMNPPLPNH